MKLSVLSLGWEYPPEIEGGLGVAFQGLNDALSQHVQLQAVVPGTPAIAARKEAKNAAYELISVSVPQNYGTYLYGADKTNTLEALGVSEFAQEPIPGAAATTLEYFFEEPMWEGNVMRYTRQMPS